jgi:hypothetical protein
VKNRNKVAGDNAFSLTLFPYGPTPNRTILPIEPPRCRPDIPEQLSIDKNLSQPLYNLFPNSIINLSSRYGDTFEDHTIVVSKTLVAPHASQNEICKNGWHALLINENSICNRYIQKYKFFVRACVCVPESATPYDPSSVMVEVARYVSRYHQHVVTLHGRHTTRYLNPKI